MENVGSSERTLTVFEIGLEPKVERQIDSLFNFQGSVSEKHSNGGVAHLGERLNGIQEVEGSIPFVSTSGKAHKRRIVH